MLDEAMRPGSADGDYVEFLSAGTVAAGAFHCSSCGYGVTVRGDLPSCPMCAGTVWEPAPWSPLERSRPNA